MRRVAVVGSSGAGKTWLASRSAAALGVEHVELDAIHHGPDWTALDAGQMRRMLEARLPVAGAWVADGNYEHKGGDLVRARADTIVWLDLPRWRVMAQLVPRTVWRAALRRPLWNGNRESFADALARDPERSVIRWSWTQHAAMRERYGEQVDERWLRLTNRRAVRGLLRRAAGAQSAASAPATAS